MFALNRRELFGPLQQLDGPIDGSCHGIGVTHHTGRPLLHQRHRILGLMVLGHVGRGDEDTGFSTRQSSETVQAPLREITRSAAA